MAGPVSIKLTAKDEASPVINKFASNAQSKLSQAVKSTSTQATTASKAFAGLSLNVNKAALAFVGFTTAQQAMRKLGQQVVENVKTIANFETAWRRVDTLGGAAAAQIDSIRDEVLRLNPALGNARDLMDGMFEAITKGASPAKALDIVTASAKATVGQLGNLRDTVGLVNQIMKAYAGENESAAEITDKLVAITQKGNATFETLIPSMGQVLGQASQLGIHWSEAGNAMAQIAIVTGDMNKATTGYRNILNQVVKRQAEFNEAGIDAIGLLKQKDGFITLMEQLGEVTNNSSFELNDFFTNIRAFNGAAIASGEILRKMRESMDHVRNSTGETEKNFLKQSNTMARGWENVGNAWDLMILKMAGSDTSAITVTLNSISDLLIEVGNSAETVNNVFRGLAVAARVADAGFKELQGSVVKLLGSIPRLAGFLQEKFGGALEFLGNKLQEQEGFLGRAGEGVTRLGEIHRQSGEAITNYGKGVQKTGDDLKKTADEDYAAVDKLLRDMANSTREATVQTDSLTNTLAGVSKNSKDTADNLGKTNDNLDGVTKKAPKAEEAITKLSESSDKAIKGVITTAKGLTLTLDDLGKSAGKASVKVVEGGKEITRELKNVETASDKTNTTASKLSVTLHKTGETFDEAALAGAKFTTVIAKSGESAVDLGKAFKTEFGEVREAILNTARDSINNFKAMSAAGTASPKAIAEAFAADFEKVRKIFGPNAPIVREMASMLDALERKAGDSTGRLRRLFEDLGTSITLPVKDMPQKYIQSFQAIIDSGEFTRQQLHKIFVDQIRPKLLEAPKGIPQAWEANFGPASDAARQLAERVNSNMQAIGDSARSAGQTVGDSLARGFDKAREAADRFHGTWLEQQEQREQAGQTAAGSISSRGGLSTPGDGRQHPGSTSGALDRLLGPAGGGQSASGVGSGDIAKLQRELLVLESGDPTTRGAAFVQRRREIIAQIAAIRDAEAKAIADSNAQFVNDQMNAHRAAVEAALGPHRSMSPMLDGPAALIPGAGQEAFAELFQGGGPRQGRDIRIVTAGQTPQALPSQAIGALGEGMVVETSTGRLVPIGSTGAMPPPLQPTDFPGRAESSGSLRALSASSVANMSAGQGSGPGTPNTREQTKAQEKLVASQNKTASSLDSLVDASTTVTRSTGGHSGVRQSAGLFFGSSFDNGGLVPEDGMFRLKKGERVYTKMEFQRAVANAARNASFGVGSDAFGSAQNFNLLRTSGQLTFDNFSGRGSTGIIGGSGEASSFAPTTGAASGLSQLAARGRLSDVLGHQTQRQLAKAIVPAQRQTIRRRDITQDVTRHTALTQQGSATVK